MSLRTNRTARGSVARLAAAAILLCAVAFAHEEIPGQGSYNVTRILEAHGQRYRVDLMYSPSLPTAGEPANIGITLVRILAVPDPLLGSELPVAEEPQLSLIYSETQQVVVPHLPLHTEGEAGVFGVAEYRFPRRGSFLLRLTLDAEGEKITADFPVTVQADSSAMFGLLVNVSVGLLILGLTGMQLWKIRARGGAPAEMARPAVIGVVSLIAVVILMDRFIVGAVLNLRKPPAAAPSEIAVTANEDGSYTIPAPVQEQLGISLIEAKQVSLDQAVSAYGEVQPRPDLTAVVQAPLWGRIEFAAKPLAVGDVVNKGQVLVNVVLELNAVERGPMDAKDLDIKSHLAQARQRRDAAQLVLDRARKLHATNPAFEADERWAKELFDEAAATYAEMVKENEKMEATKKFRDPRRTPVQSPMSGVIATMDFVPGELNATDEYRQLFTIVDPSQVWIHAEVVPADVWKLRKGQPARVYPASRSGQPVTGTIHWIGDTLDAASRTVPVIVQVANEKETFALGSFARTEFQQPQRVLAVPEGAVVDDGTTRWVYVAREEGSFAPVEIEVGVKQGGWWEVRSGIAEGDRVIASGAALLGSLPKAEGHSDVSALAPEAHSHTGH
jgi:RND family efflux transporter MFP subunit